MTQGMPRIAVFTNGLQNKGGVERICLFLARRYNADFYVGIYDADSTYEELKKARIHARVYGKARPRITQLITRRWFASLDIRGKYDVYIHLGGLAALMAAGRHRPMIFYCIMPTSWLHHNYEDELRKRPALARPVLRALYAYLRHVDRRQMRRMDAAFSISETTRRNLKDYAGIDSEVVYAPTDISSFRNAPSEGYYLFVGRLERMKRPDIVLEAFKTMPDKRLVIVGQGSLLQELRDAAKGHPNIDVRGPLSNEDLIDVYSRCIATLYPTTKEDFGLVPVESMAVGKPCIVADEAGLRETVLDQRTGLLLKEVTPLTVADAVRWMTPAKAAAMRSACEERARIFSLDAFYAKFDNEINRLKN